MKRIDHVGIVVDNLQAARQFLGEIFEFDLEREVQIPGRLNSAFYRCGDASIELIEVVDPAERSRRLGADTARIEHVAIEVDDLERVIARLRQKGVETTATVPRIAGPLRSLVTRPDTTDGVTYQIFDRRINSTPSQT